MFEKSHKSTDSSVLASLESELSYDNYEF